MVTGNFLFLKEDGTSLKKQFTFRGGSSDPEETFKANHLYVVFFMKDVIFVCP